MNTAFIMQNSEELKTYLRELAEEIKQAAKPDAVPELMNPREAAEYMRVSETTLWRATKDGLKITYVLNQPRYRKADIDAWLDEKNARGKAA